MILAALLLAAAVAPPSYLVERVVTAGDQVRRVSVFRDGTAVLARHTGGGEPAIVKITLDGVELRTVTDVLAEVYPELAGQDRVVEGVGEARVELRLAPPGKPPLTLIRPLAAVPSLAFSRLGGMLDGLERRLSSSHPQREDLSSWVPEAGDRLELEDGRTVEVETVLSGSAGPVVRVRVGDGPLSQYLAVDELRRQAVRRIRK